MKIGIVGLGLIGGSYAKSLKKYGYEIYGIDVNQESLDYALKHNIIDFGDTNPSNILKKLDVVFICLYPNDTIRFVHKNINNFKRGSIISDVVGIKRQIIDAFDIYKDDDIEFVFTHPIAGRETIGIKHSDAAIFKDANFVITPTKWNNEEAINVITILAKQMGFAKVTQIPDTAHDDIIAFTSQLTHAIALSLVNSDDEKYDTSSFIGDSYKDLTRIAQINDNLWSDLFLKNSYYLLKHIKKFEKELDILKNALKAKDKETLRELMQSATKKRGKIQ
ncbi:MAG: prephenate dehydrogenase [Candidatus Izimaplasma sp.]|nr:prephenate dehydrogenase [Candidatus Izimaplasma bacterium]